MSVEDRDLYLNPGSEYAYKEGIPVRDPEIWNEVKSGSITFRHIFSAGEGGTTHDLEVDMPSGVAVLIYRDTPGGRQVLTFQQKRPNLEQFNRQTQALESFPRGFLKYRDEPLVQAVIREAEEEVGDAGIHVRLSDIHPVKALTGFTMFPLSHAVGYGFSAKVPYSKRSNPDLGFMQDEVESIGFIRWRPIEEIPSLVETHMKDPFSVALWALTKKKIGEFREKHASGEMVYASPPQDVESEAYADLIDDEQAVLGYHTEAPRLIVENKEISHWDYVTAGPYRLVHAVERKAGVIVNETVRLFMPDMLYPIIHRTNPAYGYKEVWVEQKQGRDGEILFPHQLHDPKVRSVENAVVNMVLQKGFMLAKDPKRVDALPMFGKITDALAQIYIVEVQALEHNATRDKGVWVPVQGFRKFLEHMHDPYAIAAWEKAQGAIKGRPIYNPMIVHSDNIGE